MQAPLSSLSNLNFSFLKKIPSLFVSPPQYLISIQLLLLYFPLAAPQDMQDLSSLTGIKPVPPAVEAQS